MKFLFKTVCQLQQLLSLFHNIKLGCCLLEQEIRTLTMKIVLGDKLGTLHSRKHGCPSFRDPGRQNIFPEKIAET